MNSLKFCFPLLIALLIGCSESAPTVAPVTAPTVMNDSSPAEISEESAEADPGVEYPSLHALCKSERATPEQVRAFLNRGADVNAPDGKGQFTPLHLVAISNENPEVIAVLLEAGADVNARGTGGFTALHFAASQNRNPEILERLLMAGADVNARLDYGDTPLHMAVASVQKNPEVLRVLLRSGADANVKNNLGQIPLDVASTNQTLEGTEALKELTSSTTWLNRWF